MSKILAHSIKVRSEQDSGAQKWPPPETAEEREEVTEKETPKTYPCRCWAKEVRNAPSFETHKSTRAHEVGGTHGLKLYDEDFQSVSDVRNSFLELVVARTHEV